ncbi:hypothetical protein TRVL_00311 [Trypanosoma vivax]|nr:hypothetical protein TRVL_00311 [Trypanosoma vivax]
MQGETVCKGNPPPVDSEALRDVSRGSTAHLSQFLSEGLLDISVSNPLVQFLSPLQLQGYASRLIGLYSLRTVEDLVSCVTCETDVERLLGDQSSGQQQRDLWRAVCRWRRASGRRRRSTEKSLRCQKTPALDDATSSGAVCAGEREFMDVTDNLVHCSPSQLMRQLAFRRSERKCSAESSHLKLDDGPAACSISPHAVTKGTDILSDYVPNEVPYVALSSRDTASLTSSLSVASSPNRWSSKRYCRERLPLSSLCLGLGVIAGPHDVLDKHWDMPENEAFEPRQCDTRSASNCAPLPEQTFAGSSRAREDIVQCSVEFEALRESCRLSVESAILAYNEGVRALQQRLRSLLDKACKDQKVLLNSATAPLMETAYLRAELHLVSCNLCEDSGFTLQHGDNMSLVKFVPPSSGGCISKGVADHFHSSHLRGAGTIAGNDASSTHRFVGSTGAYLAEVQNLSELAAPVLSTRGSSPTCQMSVSPLIEDTQPSCATKQSHDAKRKRSAEVADLRDGVKIPVNDVASSVSGENGMAACSPIAALGTGSGFSSVVKACRRGGAEELPPGKIGDTSVGRESGLNNVIPAMQVTQVSSGSSSDNHGVPGIFSLESRGACCVLSCSSVDNGQSDVVHNMQMPTDVQVIDVDDMSSSRGTGRGSQFLFPGGVVLSGNDDKNCEEEEAHVEESWAVQDEVSPHSSQGRSCIGTCTQLSEGEGHDAVDPYSSTNRGEWLGAFSDDPVLSLDKVGVAPQRTASASLSANVKPFTSLVALDALEDRCENQGELSGDEDYMNDITVTSKRASFFDLSPPLVSPLPLPPKDATNSLSQVGTFQVGELPEHLNTEQILSMDYDALLASCTALGLQVPTVDVCSTKDSDFFFRGNCCEGQSQAIEATLVESTGGVETTVLHEENSNLWLFEDNSNGTFEPCSELGGPHVKGGHRYHYEGEDKLPYSCSPFLNGGSDCGTASRAVSPGLVDTAGNEWYQLRRAAQEDRMREALRQFVTRRTFIHEVVPSFFHRLPRFSGGPLYKRLRVADLVRPNLALTREDLEEQRRKAKIKEMEEVTCCVISSLAGNAAENIECDAVSMMRHSASLSALSLNTPRASPVDAALSVNCNVDQYTLSAYERILLLEPVDIDAVISIVRSDFPDVPRNRVEALIEASGVPLDSSHRVCSSQAPPHVNAHTPPRSSPSPSPPPNHGRQVAPQSIAGSSQMTKRRYFAQRGCIPSPRGGQNTIRNDARYGGWQPGCE